MRYANIIMSLLCAWVLWGEGESGSLHAMEAFESKSDCEAGRQSYYDINKRTNGHMLFSCLPDTIDPRTPKVGK